MPMVQDLSYGNTTNLMDNGAFIDDERLVFLILVDGDRAIQPTSDRQCPL